MADQQDIVNSPYKYFSLGNYLSEKEGETANFYVFQKVFKGDFQFDVLFRSQSSNNPITSKSQSIRLSLPKTLTHFIFIR